MKPSHLTAKQTRFISEYLVDSNGAAAAVRAGYAHGSAKVAASRMLTKDNPVRRAIQARQDAESERLGIDRQKAVSGLLEAVDQARAQRNPMAMIRGWAEIGRMMGFYAPEVKKVGLSVAGEAEMARLNRLSDAELVKLIEDGKAAGR